MKPLFPLLLRAIAATAWLAALPPSALAFTVTADSPAITVDTRARVSITVTAVNGTVTGGGEYPGDTTAMLTATPAPGYVFTSWAGDVTATDNPLFVLMDGDKFVEANFVTDSSDTDVDGLSAYLEVVIYGTNPLLADTDGDNLLDGAEVNTHGSSPLLKDTDEDGLSDGVEVQVHQSNPTLKDSDSDGFDDLFEVNTGFNPALATSTPDAVSSIRTAVEFRFNAATGANYRIESSTDLDQWDVIEPVIVGQGAVVTRFYSIENQPKRYFRVRRN